MELITLEEFQGHARIVDDSEDDAAEQIVAAANEYVTGLLCIDDEEPYEPPADLKQAVLLIASHWWENRDNSFPGNIQDIPLDASEILLNHRGWAF